MAFTGLIKFHYAKQLTDVPGVGATYDTPKPVGSAISLSETPTTSMTTLYAENGPSETAAANGPTAAEIGVKDLTDEVLADLLGQTINADGVRIQSRNDTAPYVALGFQMTSESGDDAFVWLFKGKFARPSRTANTKGESVEFNTPTITATFISRDFDGEEKATIRKNATNSAITDSWFEAVYEPVPTP
ncbi:major tail protein [Jeotgalibacillus aurantiacus]|uniref:major tail protein n=2 Tax=Jeotgalibacillus aurantiacus TaxID=2763266 RepID=UPI001D0ACB4B|nr:major tail protein [Jeotgalibacillus aurantiacus]